MAVTVVTGEGRRIMGSSALDVVRQMNARALIGESDAWRYMVALSGRILRLTGLRIRTTPPEAFLVDLAAAGYITMGPPAEVATGAPGEALPSAGS